MKQKTQDGILSWIIIILSMFWLTLLFFVLSKKIDTCTPSQEHQAVMEKLESIDHWLHDIHYACQQ